jgi:hypothetical protein
MLHSRLTTVGKNDVGTCTRPAHAEAGSFVQSSIGSSDRQRVRRGIPPTPDASGLAGSSPFYRPRRKKNQTKRMIGIGIPMSHSKPPVSMTISPPNEASNLAGRRSVPRHAEEVGAIGATGAQARGFGHSGHRDGVYERGSDLDRDCGWRGLLTGMVVGPGIAAVEARAFSAYDRNGSD